MELSELEAHPVSNSNTEFISNAKSQEDIPALLQNIKEEIPWDLSDLITSSLDLEEPVQSLCVTTFHARSENENRNDQQGASVSPLLSSGPDAANTVKRVPKSGKRKCLQCSHCDFTTNWPSHLRRHITMHHGDAILRCDNCDYFTYKEKLLKSHRLKCLNSVSCKLKTQKNRRKSKLLSMIEYIKEENNCEQNEEFATLNQDDVQLDSYEPGNDCELLEPSINNVSGISSSNSILRKCLTTVSVEKYNDTRSCESDSQSCKRDPRSCENNTRPYESSTQSSEKSATSMNFKSYRKRPLLKCSLCKFKTYLFIKYCSHLKTHVDNNVAQNDSYLQTEESENKSIENTKESENRYISNTEKSENKSMGNTEELKNVENTYPSESKSRSENIIFEAKKRKYGFDFSNDMYIDCKRKLKTFLATKHGLIYPEVALPNQMDKKKMIVVHDLKTTESKNYLEALENHNNFMDAELIALNEKNDKSKNLNKIDDQPKDLNKNAEPNEVDIEPKDLDEVDGQPEDLNKNSEPNEMNIELNNLNKNDAEPRELDNINIKIKDLDDVSVCSSFYGFDDDDVTNRKYHEFYSDKDVQDNLSDKVVKNNTNKLIIHYNKVINNNNSFDKRLHSKVNKVFKCSMCNYQSKWYSCLYRHKSRHTNNRFYKCQNCDYTTHSAKILQNHQSKCIGLLQTFEAESSSTISISSSRVFKSKPLASISNSHLGFPKSPVSTSEKNIIYKRRSFNPPERTKFSKRRSEPPKRFADFSVSSPKFHSNLSKPPVNLSQSFESTLMSPIETTNAMETEQTNYRPVIERQPFMPPKQRSCSSMDNLRKCHEEQEQESYSHDDNNTSHVKLPTIHNKIREDSTKYWRCRHCDHLSRSLNSFKRHLLTHSNFKVFKCKFCDYSTNVKKLAKNHYIRYHSSVINEKCCQLGGLVTQSEVVDQLCTPDEDAMNINFSMKHDVKAPIRKSVGQRNCNINQIINECEMTDGVTFNSEMIDQAEVHSEIGNRVKVKSKVVDQTTVESENSPRSNNDDAKYLLDTLKRKIPANLSTKVTKTFKKRQRLSALNPKTGKNCNIFTEQSDANAEVITGGTTTHPILNSFLELKNKPKNVFSKDKDAIVLEKQSEVPDDKQDKCKISGKSDARLKVSPEFDATRKDITACDAKHKASTSSNAKRKVSNSCSTTNISKNLNKIHADELQDSNTSHSSQPGQLRNNFDSSYIDGLGIGNNLGTSHMENGIQPEYVTLDNKATKHMEVAENADINKTNSNIKLDAYCSNQYSVFPAQKKSKKLIHQDMLNNQNEIKGCKKSLLSKSFNLVKDEYERKIQDIIEDTRAFFSGLETFLIDKNPTTKMHNLVNEELCIIGPKNKSIERKNVSCKIVSNVESVSSKQIALVDSKISSVLGSSNKPPYAQVNTKRLDTDCNRTPSSIDFSNARIHISDSNVPVSLDNNNIACVPNGNDSPDIHSDNNSLNIVDNENTQGTLVDSNGKKFGALVDNSRPVIINDSTEPGASSKRKRNIKVIVKTNQKQDLREKENNSGEEHKGQTYDRKKSDLLNNESDRQNNKSDLRNNKSDLRKNVSDLQNNKLNLLNNKSDLQNNKSNLLNNKSDLNKSDLLNNKSDLQNNKSNLQNNKSHFYNTKSKQCLKSFSCPSPSCTFTTNFSANVRRHAQSCHKDFKYINDVKDVNSSLIVAESSCSVANSRASVTSTDNAIVDAINSVNCSFHDLSNSGDSSRDSNPRLRSSASKYCGSDIINKSATTTGMSIASTNNSITSLSTSGIRASSNISGSDESSMEKEKSSVILTDDEEASLLKADHPKVREVANSDSATVSKVKNREKFCDKSQSESLSHLFNEIEKITIRTRTRIIYGRGERLKNKDKRSDCKRRFPNANSRNGKKIKNCTNKTTRTSINKTIQNDFQGDKSSGEMKNSGNEINVGEIEKRTIRTRARIIYGRGERLKNKYKNNDCKRRFPNANSRNGKKIKNCTNKTTRTSINKTIQNDFQCDRSSAESGEMKNSGNEINVGNNIETRINHVRNGNIVETNQNASIRKEVDENMVGNESNVTIEKVLSKSIKNNNDTNDKKLISKSFNDTSHDNVKRIPLSKGIKNKYSNLILNVRRSEQRISDDKRNVIRCGKQAINTIRKRQIKNKADKKSVGNNSTKGVTTKRTSSKIINEKDIKEEDSRDSIMENIACETGNGLHYPQNFDVKSEDTKIKTKPSRNDKKSFVYSCLHCPKKSNFKYAMLNHLKVTNHRVNIYTCKHCTFGTHDRDLYQNHKTVHLIKNRNIFRCLVCHFVTTWKGAMKTHVDHFHHRAYLYKCKECFAQFCEKEEFQIHVQDCLQR